MIPRPDDSLESRIYFAHRQLKLISTLLVNYAVNDESGLLDRGDVGALADWLEAVDDAIEPFDRDLPGAVANWTPGETESTEHAAAETLEGGAR